MFRLSTPYTYILVSVALLTPAAVVLGQDFELGLPEVEGLAGNTVEIAVTLTSDIDVEAITLEVCHGEVLTIGEGEVALGDAWEDETFETLAFEFDDDSWSVTAIIDLDESDPLSEGTDLQLFVASYKIEDTGTADLEFCSDPVVTADGEEYDAEVSDGSVVSSAPEFLRGDIDGDGYVHPLLDSRFVLEWLFRDGDDPPCLDAVDVLNGGRTSALIAGVALMRWGFRNSADFEDPGTTDCGPDPESDFLGCETPADPCATDFELPEANSDYQLSIADEVGMVDDTATISILLENDGDPLTSLQMSVCHDDDFVSLDTGNVLRGSAFDDLEFAFSFVVVEGDGFTTALMLDYEDGEAIVLDPDDELELYTAIYNLDAAGDSAIEFCDIGERAVASAQFITDDMVLVVPETNDGSIEVLDDAIFKRGDVNNDAVVSALADASFLLRWGFVNGDAPPCMDAADVDDSDEVSALSDSLSLLRWAFQSGDAPPDPGTAECGPDPTEDDVECEESSADC